MTNAASHIRRGFTLVEMVLSMAVMTILLGGIASAMILASRAMPDLATPLKAMADGYYAADQLAGELFAAQTITARSATSVTFTVADRNNDSIAETIRYSWGGAGQPLTRQYNIGTGTCANANCTGVGTPWSCCTAGGTGTCTSAVNAGCVSAGVPWACCTGSGVGSTVLDNVYQFNLGYVTQVISSVTKVTIVNITLRAGTDATSRVDTSVQLLNQPS
jgi:prepilin-type N-terminal cleavage/methylation domain-containing protein